MLWDEPFRRRCTGSVVQVHGVSLSRHGGQELRALVFAFLKKSVLPDDQLREATPIADTQRFRVATSDGNRLFQTP